jgi:hypothetical protein
MQATDPVHGATAVLVTNSVLVHRQVGSGHYLCTDLADATVMTLHNATAETRTLRGSSIIITRKRSEDEEGVAKLVDALKTAAENGTYIDTVISPLMPRKANTYAGGNELTYSRLGDNGDDLRVSEKRVPHSLAFLYATKQLRTAHTLSRVAQASEQNYAYDVLFEFLRAVFCKLGVISQNNIPVLMARGDRALIVTGKELPYAVFEARFEKEIKDVLSRIGVTKFTDESQARTKIFECVEAFIDAVDQASFMSGSARTFAQYARIAATTKNRWSAYFHALTTLGQIVDSVTGISVFPHGLESTEALFTAQLGHGSAPGDIITLLNGQGTNRRLNYAIVKASTYMSLFDDDLYAGGPSDSPHPVLRFLSPARDVHGARAKLLASVLKVNRLVQGATKITSIQVLPGIVAPGADSIGAFTTVIHDDLLKSVAGQLADLRSGARFSIMCTDEEFRYYMLCKSKIALMGTVVKDSGSAIAYTERSASFRMVRGATAYSDHVYVKLDLAKGRGEDRFALKNRAFAVLYAYSKPTKKIDGESASYPYARTLVQYNAAELKAKFVTVEGWEQGLIPAATEISIVQSLTTYGVKPATSESDAETVIEKREVIDPILISDLIPSQDRDRLFLAPAAPELAGIISTIAKIGVIERLISPFNEASSRIDAGTETIEAGANSKNNGTLQFRLLTPTDVVSDGQSALVHDLTETEIIDAQPYVVNVSGQTGHDKDALEAHAAQREQTISNEITLALHRAMNTQTIKQVIGHVLVMSGISVDEDVPTEFYPEYMRLCVAAFFEFVKVYAAVGPTSDTIRAHVNSVQRIMATDDRINDLVLLDMSIKQEGAK